MGRELFKNQHLIFKKEDFPDRRESEPWLIHAAYADWTEGHNHVMHRHEDISEIFLLLHGNGKYTVGGRMYELNEGDIVLCNPHVMHDEFPGECDFYDTIAIGIGGLVFPGLSPGYMIDLSHVPVLRKSEQTEELKGLCLMLMKYSVPGETRNPALMHRLLLAVVELLQDIVRKADLSAQEIDPLCAAVEQYLNEHYGENVTLEETAKHFYVSPWHLSRLFKKETSYNFKQYLLRLRLGESQMRLVVSEDSIGKIALSCGFHDPAYFSRVFTSYIGLSPSRFRRLRTENR